MGAVTTALPRPSSASRAAVSMADAAARPVSAEGTPGSKLPQIPSVDGMRVTSRPESDLGSKRSAGTERKRSGTRARRAARSITSGSPTAATRASRRSERSARVRARISGPMPAGSPIVKRSVCRRGATCSGPPRVQSLTSMLTFLRIRSSQRSYASRSF